MVLVIIVALVGSDVKPENVNFTSKERIEPESIVFSVIMLLLINQIAI